MIAVKVDFKVLYIFYLFFIGNWKNSVVKVQMIQMMTQINFFLNFVS
jgi:hypothetical protein